MYEKRKYWATSYAVKARELYYRFPTSKYLRIKRQDLPSRFHEQFSSLYGEMFRYFLYLVIKDIVENQVMFKFPGSRSVWIQMDPVTGDDFKIARQKGGFQDVDYLVSNFTGYSLYLRYNSRYGHWKKRIHISSKYRDKITELTNKGVKW